MTRAQRRFRDLPSYRYHRANQSSETLEPTFAPLRKDLCEGLTREG